MREEKLRATAPQSAGDEKIDDPARELRKLREENRRLKRKLKNVEEADRLSALRIHLTLFSHRHTLEEVLVETLDKIEELTGSEMSFYHFLHEDQETLTLMAWSTATVARFCEAEGKGSHYSVSQAGVWAQCIQEGRAVIHNDYPALSHRKGLPPGHAPVARELVVPVLRNDKIVALIGVGNKRLPYDEGDVEKVSRLADLAWDIAERKMFLQRIQESEARFRAIADYSYDWELWVGTDGGIIWTNPEVEAFTGYPVEKLLAGKTFPMEILEERHREKMEEHLTKARGGASANNFQFAFHHGDGTLKWAAMAYRPILDDQGRNIGFRASVRDITDLKRTEEELDRLNDKLIEMLSYRR